MTIVHPGALMTETETLVVLRCGECQMLYAMPTSLHERLKGTERGKTFYCPAGHPRVYAGKSDAEKRAERAERRLADEQEWSRIQQAEVQSLRKAHAVTKGKLTKARNRADRGVCLHCHRTFAAVAAHVERMHPEAGAA
jgi:hypothetical protein